MNQIVYGTVKSFDHISGNGWITPEKGGRDIYVNQAAVKKARLGQICPGQTLGFHISNGTQTATDLWATWSNR